MICREQNSFEQPQQINVFVSSLQIEHFASAEDFAIGKKDLKICDEYLKEKR